MLSKKQEQAVDVFASGDAVALHGSKGRIFVFHLAAGKTEGWRGTRYAHDALIGQPVGITLEAKTGEKIHALRPTLSEYVVKMPRFATVVYPKDLGVLLIEADLSAGLSVLEAGLGSGALAIALLRVIGPTGRLVSYDVRPESLEAGRRNVSRFLGGAPDNHVIEQADIYEGIGVSGLDRIVLDVPEPWRVLEHSTHAMKNGGIIACYLPTIVQVAKTVSEIRASRGFAAIRTVEVLEREWHVSARSVRPRHDMVGHTGFLVFARKLCADTGEPASPASFDAWGRPGDKAGA